MKHHAFIIIICMFLVLVACSQNCEHDFIWYSCDELSESGQEQIKLVCRDCAYEMYKELNNTEKNESETIQVAEPLVEETTEETIVEFDWADWEEALYKLEAYEIISHSYKEESDVLIEGIIDNITESSFDLWMPYANSYYKISNFSYDISLDDIEAGHTVQIYMTTHRDGSLAKTKGIIAIRKTDAEMVGSIVEEFKNTCPAIDYNGIMRKPEEAYGTLCKATGRVIQVIDTKNYRQEFLLSMDDGNLVYVAYSKKENADNVLENDIVTIYGIFYMTESYTTVLGTEKTVPRIPADYVDIHN